MTISLVCRYIIKGIRLGSGALGRAATGYGDVVPLLGAARSRTDWGICIFSIPKVLATLAVNCHLARVAFVALVEVTKGQKKFIVSITVTFIKSSTVQYSTSLYSNDYRYLKQFH